MVRSTGAAAPLTCIVMCLAPPVTLAAQQAPRAGPPNRTVFGFGVGAGSIPAAFRPTCSSRQNGRTPAVSVDARAGRTFGAFRVETSTATRGAVVMEDCLYLGPRGRNGVETLRYSALRVDAPVTTDVRVSHASGAGNAWWLFAGGVGWTWSHNTPVLVFATGIRLGGRVRFALDADVHRYRIPWDEVTAEWQDGLMVREIERKRVHDWRSGVMVRLGLEMLW